MTLRRIPLKLLRTTGANDGDVPTYDSATDRLVYAAPPAGGGGGAVLAWNQVLTLSGTAWVAADWATVAGGGTWSSDGSVIKTTAVASTHNRASRVIESIEGADFLAVEAEVLVPTTGFIGDAGRSIGLSMAPVTAASGGASFRFDGNNQVRVERDGVANRGTAPFTLTANTWYRLTMLTDKLGNVRGFVNGSQVIGPIATGATISNTQRPSLYTWNFAGNFRNIKAWRYEPVVATPALPS